MTNSSSPIKRFVANIPVIGSLARSLKKNVVKSKGFEGSAAYWERRYAQGGTSGAGSYGRLANFKAETLNQLVRDNRFSTVVEFGCGDGAQLTLAEYPHYVGVDVSRNSIARCREQFGSDTTKSFVLTDDFSTRPVHDLALSLDVIYHLVEDAVFDRYMHTLFESASKMVVVYASNRDEQPPDVHVRHRAFTRWVASNKPDWKQSAFIKNRYPFNRDDPDETSFADFFVFVPTSA